MTGIVIDASVALKWVLDEEGSEEAAQLAGQPLVAPELFLAECANALWATARRSDLTSAEVWSRLKALQSAPVERVPLDTLIEDAMILALELNHPVYDCIYLALALQRNLVVVTADRRLVKAVRQRPERASLVRPLLEA